MSLRDRYIFLSIASFVFGIIVSSFIHTAPVLAVFFILVACFIALAERIGSGRIGSGVLMLVTLITGFSVGVIRYDAKDFHEPSALFETRVGGSMIFDGVVVSEPERRDTGTRIIVASEGEKILVTTDMYAHVAYGDVVRVSGKLAKPGVIEGGGRPFDYRAYLAREDVYYTVSFAKVTVVAHGYGNSVIGFLLTIKTAFIERARRILSEPESSLLAGLLVAGKDALPMSLLEEFRRAGLVHLVVLSGYNITVVAEFLRKVVSSFSLRVASAASIVGIVLFVLIAGATPSIIRAAIMAGIAMGGKIFHRRYHAGRALLVAAVLMLLHNPKILVFDPSFHLSFLATLGMMYGAPVLEKYLEWIPEKFGLRSLVAVTIGTQVLVAPYILFSMGGISIVSLASNILVLPLVPLTMLVGFIAVLCGFASAVVAVPLAYVSHLLLSWILGVAHAFGKFTWATIHINHLAGWFIAAVYVALAVMWWRVRNSLQQPAS